MFLANGFEDTEALSTRDVLIRAGIEMVTASIDENRQVQSSFGLTLLADKPIGVINSLNEFDFLVLPGGGRGTENLYNSNEVDRVIKHFIEKDKLIAAICAAPSILGRRGYLKGYKYTCFAGCNKGIEDALFTGDEVTVDGNFITGRSMKYSIPFALAIVEKLLGSAVKEKVLVGLKGQTEK